MPINLSGRPFLRLLDFSTEEIEYLLKLSKNFKDLKRTGTPHRYLEGKNIVLLFQKTSTRTRCAFEVGAMDLGMGVTYLDPGSSQMGKKESIEDTARVLGRFYDGILMDPPSYGRGPGGEVWKLEDNLYPFLELCSRVLSDKPLFVVLNSYTTGLAPSVLGYILQLLVGRKFGGTVTWDELGLPCTESGMALPCGATGRWFSE